MNYRSKNSARSPLYYRTCCFIYKNRNGYECDYKKEKKDFNSETRNDAKQARTRPQIFTASSAVPTPLVGYKPFRQQVGGHLMVQDDPCFMLDDHDHLLKLLEEKSLGEKTFYEAVFMEEPENEEWFELRRFLPRYYGTVAIFNGKVDLNYLKIDNVVSHLKQPCIMDLKVGRKTFDPFAPPDKVQRELIRYKYQAQLGFRITGFKVYKAKIGRTELFDRFHCKCIKPDNVVETFIQFFDLEDYPERKGLVDILIQKLQLLLKWFEKQTRFKFFRTSLLISYDGNMQLHPDRSQSSKITGNKGIEDFTNVSRKNIYKLEGSEYINGKFNISGITDVIGRELLKEHDAMNNDVNPTDVSVNMIDFAHTFLDLDSPSLDENYLFGLRSLIYNLEQCRNSYLNM